VPSVANKLLVGNLVTVNVYAILNNYCADMAKMSFVENSDQKLLQFVAVAQRILN